MHLEEFYRRLLPSSGTYALWYRDGGFPKHVFFRSIEDLIAGTQDRLNVVDLYYATASFTGRKRDQDSVHLIKSLRIDIDAGPEKHAKDPEGTYPDARTAVIALREAVTAGLPKPTVIVTSGFGLHVYWQLSEDVSAAEWQVAADALKLACAHVGLRADPKITADSARILRPLGSLHNCGAAVGAGLARLNPDAVYDLDAITATLKALVPQDAFPSEAVAKYDLSVNAEALHVEMPPASIHKVADNCAAIAWVRDTRGDVPEPVWRQFMGVAKYCADGQDVIHPWSQGDDRYDEAETQAKFDRWETPPATCDGFLPYGKCSGCKHQGRIKTPKQLGYVSQAPEAEEVAPAKPQAPEASDPQDLPEPEVAMAMPVLDRPTSECAVPGRPDLFDETQPFFFAENKEHWVLYHNAQVKDNDATGADIWKTVRRKVVHRLIWVDSCTQAGATDTGSSLTMIGCVDRIDAKTYQILQMPAETTASPDTLTKFMHGQGIFTDAENASSKKDLAKFILREQIRSQENMNFVVRDRFGYHHHDGALICCQGSYAVYPRGTPGGEIRRVVMNHKIQAMGTALGTSCLPDSRTGQWDGSAWREYVAPAAARYIGFLRKHYNHSGYEVARLALSVCLASPFLVFAADAPLTDDPELPATGLVVSLFSQGSGKGKSAIQEVIAAAYGKASLKRAGKKSAMTETARNTLAHQTAIYPFIMDEVTRNGAEDTAQMIDTLANGQGRVRAQRDGSVTESAKTWAFVSCLSTNMPQRELLALAQKSSNALNLRLLELDFDSLTASGNHSEFVEDFKRLTLDAGAFGLLLAYFAVNRGEGELTFMTQANMRKAYEFLEVGQDYRFFARGLAAMMTMHELLGKYAPFDLDELKQTYKDTVITAAMAVTPEGNNALNDINKLVNDLSANIAVTKTWNHKRGAHATEDVITNPNVRLPLVGRESQADGVVVILKSAVQAWCTENEVSFKGFLDRAHKANLLIVDRNGKAERRMVLTSGLRSMPTVNAWALRFRTNPVAIVAREEGTGPAAEQTGTD